MGALAHFIEREGVATTSISLIREHSEAMNPPRALWVSFYLGRPFGVPDDPDFQRDVLRAALHLLPTLSTHGIVDYPIDAPAASFSDTWACPVAFAAADSDTLAGRLRAEVLGLAPWWRETHRARGRSVVGGSGPVAGEDVPTHAETLAAVLAAVAEGAELDRVPDAGAGVAWGHPMPYLLRHIAQDLRSYYQEAVVAQPGALAAGQAPSHRALNNWIFQQTALGEAIIEAGRRLTETGDPRLRVLRFWTVPEGYWPDADTPVAGPPVTDRMALADSANTLFRGGG